MESGRTLRRGRRAARTSRAEGSQCTARHGPTGGASRRVSEAAHTLQISARNPPSTVKHKVGELRRGQDGNVEMPLFVLPQNLRQPTHRSADRRNRDTAALRTHRSAHGWLHEWAKA